MMNPDHPIFAKLPDGQNAINTQDGLIPVVKVNVEMAVNVTTAIITPNGPMTMPIHDALAIQTTLAAHWLRRFEETKTQLADARAQLSEASTEGRVYELPADIAVTPEEFGRLKELEKALAMYFDIDDADGIVDLHAKITDEGAVDGTMPIRLPDEMMVALRKLGVSTVGGLRAFLEAHNLRREAALVDAG